MAVWGKQGLGVHDLTHSGGQEPISWQHRALGQIGLSPLSYPPSSFILPQHPSWGRGPLWAFLTPIFKWCFPGDLAPKGEEDFTLTLDTFLHVQQLRKKRLRAFCSQSGKVTTLLRSQELRGNVTPAVPLPYSWQHTRKTQLGEFNLTEIETILGSYTKVLFVRDPFQRLISAFMQGMGSSPSFSSFVQEFLDSRQQASVAWKPLVRLCQPCLIQYDYVVMFGFLRQELGHLLRRAGLPTDSLPSEFTDTQVQWTYSWLSEFGHGFFVTNIPMQVQEVLPKKHITLSTLHKKVRYDTGWHTLLGNHW
uniref:Carbohydrate sulfotransferase n=1 Tax=Otus sunia TaxID=257818 RepID=A0A8C8ASB4_9STRI